VLRKRENLLALCWHLNIAQVSKNINATKNI